MRTACVPVLLRILAGDHEDVARAAANVLADFSERDDDIKGTLLRLFHEPRSIKTMHAAFIALGCGWSEDADVAGLALQLRQTPLAGVQIEAIRVRAARGEAELDDLKIFAEIAYGSEHWTDACLARDTMGQAEVDFLCDELDAVGPAYAYRRAAAVGDLPSRKRPTGLLLPEPP